MQLDIRTLLLLTAIYGFILGPVMIFLKRTQKYSRGFVQIGIGNIVFAFGYLFFSFNQYLHDFISIVMANVLIFVGLVFLSYGVSSLYNHSKRWYIIDVILMVSLTIFYIYFTLINANVNIRILVVSILEAYYFIRIALLSFSPKESYTKNARYIVGYLFAILATYDLVRFISTLSGSRIDTFLETGFIQALSVIIYQFIPVIVLIGAFWYSNSIIENLLTIKATTDGLTNLMNRNHFIDVAIKLTQKNARWGLAMIDIDHFKRINDRFGHVNGDLALKKVCNILSSFECNNCIIGRYGGEEFLLLKELDVDENWRKTLNILRQRTSEYPIILNEESITLTISIGGMTFSNQSFEKSLIDSVDQSLYKAKASGRNNVIVN